MLYMVEIRYSRERRDDLFDYFQKCGVTGYQPGVGLRGAWVSTEECVGYALVDVADAAAFESERARLAPFGDVTSRHVHNAEDL